MNKKNKQPDSTCFDGTEQKIEIVVRNDSPSLRTIAFSKWHDLLAFCPLKIISTLTGSQCTSHLLSESSLLVFDHRLLLITCGGKPLKKTLENLMELVNPSRVVWFQFQRTSQANKEDDDAKEFFFMENFLTRKSTFFWGENKSRIGVFSYYQENPFPELPVRLELEMHQLGGKISSSSTKKTLENLLTGFQIQDHDFTPCGYSLNAIWDIDYATLHVTPQKPSYAGLEISCSSHHEAARFLQTAISHFQPSFFNFIQRGGFYPMTPVVANYRVVCHRENLLTNFILMMKE